MNRRDVDGIVQCMAPDYASEQPLHPQRDFRGQEHVQENWSDIFQRVPDFQAQLQSCAADRNTIWTEWHWYGTQADGKPWAIRGVAIFGIHEDRIIWGRLYLEPVSED